MTDKLNFLGIREAYFIFYMPTCAWNHVLQISSADCSFKGTCRSTQTVWITKVKLCLLSVCPVFCNQLDSLQVKVKMFNVLGSDSSL